MKKLIKMYNEKYGDTLGVIDDDFNKEQMYRIYYFIKNNCDDKDIQDRIKMIHLDKPKTLEQQLTKLEGENGNSNIKKYIDDNTVIHPLPVYEISETSSMITYIVNIMDLKKLTTYGAIRDMNSTKYQRYRFVYICDDGKKKTIVNTSDTINDTTFRVYHYGTSSTLTFNNKIYSINYTNHSTSTDVVVTESIQNYLGIYNTQEYTPTENYHPSTKKYVDDKIKDELGDEELTTVNKDVKGAINEVNAQYKDIANKTITTDERNKLTNLENYDDTSIKANIQNVQQQVNNLVLGAVGDGNNAEVVQARSNYSTLNDRINNNESKDKDILTFLGFSWKSGYLIDVSGHELQNTNNDTKVTDFIDFEENIKVYFSSINDNQYVCAIAFYDKNKKFISGQSNVGQNDTIYNTTSPSGTKYIRMCAKDENHYRLYVEESIISSKLQLINATIQDLNEDKLSRIYSKNLFDKNKLTKGKYLLDIGTIGDNEDYSISDFIPVIAGEKYTYTDLKAYGASACYYDKYKQFVKGYNPTYGAAETITIPEGVSYLRVSVKNSLIDTTQIEKGSTSTVYEDYTEYLPFMQLSNQFKTLSTDVEKINNVIPSPLSGKKDTLNNDDYIEFEVSNCKQNNTISFSAQVTSFGSLEITHGQTEWYNCGKIVIDSTSVKYYTFSGVSNLEADFQHNLTIKDIINVTINVGDRHRSDGWHNNKVADIIVTTNGGFFKEKVKWNGCAGKVQAKSINSVLKNCTLTFSCRDYLKDIWAFGDSYFDMWSWICNEWGFSNYMMDGFSGRASADAVKSLEFCLKYRTPKKIMWCMGMNDPDSDSAINATYKENLDKVRNICTEKNIELILFTIPNVPDRNHKLKNTYIKGLGLRFVDISLAVGAEDSNNWYDGLLSADKVHPDTKGQYVIASKVIAEVPEIADEFIR